MAVLAIHDLSCFSKSSLTVALPVMEALSVETAVLPTALLSTQTDGFDDIYIRDLSGDMTAIDGRFSSLGLRFDGIYSGFLASVEQIDIVSSIIDKYATLTLVDPVMGDDGKLYQTITEDHAAAMIRLARKADIITPNFTEASIIAGSIRDISYTRIWEQVLEKKIKLDSIKPTDTKELLDAGIRMADLSEHKLREYAEWLVDEDVHDSVRLKGSSPDLGYGRRQLNA